MRQIILAIQTAFSERTFPRFSHSYSQAQGNDSRPTCRLRSWAQLLPGRRRGEDAPDHRVARFVVRSDLALRLAWLGHRLSLRRRAALPSGQPL
jgi:hypothetical protein